MDFERLQALLKAFEKEGVAYAIFGAIALNLRLPFGDQQVTVVTPRTLYRMKRDTIRLKDRADAELLKQRFKLEEG